MARKIKLRNTEEQTLIWDCQNIQFYPADKHTANLISYASNNVWWVTIDKTSFTYNLRRIGTYRFFSVKFDLTKEVKTPSAPWGRLKIVF